MQSLKAAATLLAVASLCASAVARQHFASDFRLEFEGNRVFPSEQLRGAAESCYRKGHDWEKGLDRELLDYCLRNDVAEMMRRVGYVRARMGEPKVLGLGETVTVTVPVEENEFYRMGSLTILGASHFDAKQLRELLPLKRGDIADSAAVSRWAFEHLQKKYADEGFIRYQSDIDPEYRIEPGASEGVLDLTLNVDEGKQFTVRKLDFKLDSSVEVDVPEEVLRRALRLKEGQVFGAQKFNDGVARLNRLDLFSRLSSEGETDPEFEEVDAVKDVVFHADEETGELDIKIYLMERGRKRPGAADDVARPGKPSLIQRR
jgi:outer membrane protein assembly factor BamA